MNHLKYISTVLMLIISIVITMHGRRSVYRPKDPLMPEIITKWLDNDNEHYHLKSYYFEEHALFKQFDREYFMDHLLPQGPITYRNQADKSVTGAELSKLAEHLLIELHQHKERFTDVTVLKDRDFNKRTVSGYLIVKFKHYPFVLKLSIETPKTFVKPFSKGWQSSCFFIMGGGVNRYLTGFNRIKNLKAIRKLIAKDPYWSQLIDTPRKWFWLPTGCRWFELRGKNIGKKADRSIELPSVYGIFVDAIEKRKEFTLFNKHNRQFALELSHYLHNRIDPHIDNFMTEKRTGKVILVDTEHFPTMVGLKKRFYYTSYPDWYIKLTWKYLIDRFGRHKKLRRRLQSHPTPTLLPC
jgi:hypothetical protein